MALKSTNPMFNKFDHSGSNEYAVEYKTATILGISIKTIILILVIFASFGLFMFLLNTFPTIALVLWVASPILIILCSIFGYVFPKVSSIFSIIYAASWGILLGLITLSLNEAFPGIGYIASLGTMLIFIVMLLLYTNKKIRVTNTFIKIFASFGITIFITWIAVFIIGLISPSFMEQLSSSWPLMLLVSVVLLAYGALCLVMDFNRAYLIVSSNAPKHYEWVAAFGLLVSLIWIYIQLLRLLALILGRRK
ncbi:MAG: Bax inhibitor-1/YccA family protein [Acholeplasmatales bacterium]|jgi:uncharacterized YccA/Bax inhibitor family protein|nr:Bax inhibitor-1/YccA family protein [Acholeplasmatales bacterium]